MQAVRVAVSVRATEPDRLTDADATSFEFHPRIPYFDLSFGAYPRRLFD
jgi:hypothetical protein